MFDLVRPRRRWSRRRVYRTRCQAIRVDSFELVAERILDLAVDGALLACDRPVEVGEELLLSFRSPWQGPWIDVAAVVQRVVGGWREADADADAGGCAGVRFSDLDPALRRELERRLSVLAPAAPSPRPPVDYAETVRRIALGVSAPERPRRLSRLRSVPRTSSSGR